MKTIDLDVDLPPPPHNLIIREGKNKKIVVKIKTVSIRSGIESNDYGPSYKYFLLHISL